MSDTVNPETYINQKLQRQFIRSTHLLAAVDTDISGSFARAKTLKLTKAIQNSKVDEPTDVTALETKPTNYAQPNTTSTDLDRKFLRGYGEYNEIEQEEQILGDRARDLQQNITIANDLAIAMDSKIMTEISKSANFSGTNKNQFTAGTDGSIFLSRSNGLETGDIQGAINDQLRRIRARYANLNVMGGIPIGDGGQIPRFNLVCNIAVADSLAEWLADKGQLRDRSDIVGRALIDRTVFGTEAYRGTTVGGFNILGVVDGTLAVPTGTDDWKAYVVPTNGAVYAAYDHARTYEDRVGQTPVMQKVVIYKYAVLAYEPTWLMELTIKAD